MKKTIRLDLPYPPSVNTYWRSNGKRRYISPAGVKFTEEVSLIVKMQKPKTFADKQVAISVMIHPRSKRKFDLDNTLKAILAGKFAFITPVITLTEGLCVAIIK